MLSEKNCEPFYGLFGHIERVTQFVERTKRDKFYELLSEKMILLVPFLVISLVDHFFGEFFLSIFGKKVIETFVTIFDKFDFA